MRELRLFDDRPEQNARTIQHCQAFAPDNTTTFRLTTSSESFSWTPSLAACMLRFIHYLYQSNKTLAVRLHGFSADDADFQEWFLQACNWNLISGLVTNSVPAHVSLISKALEEQRQIKSVSLKLYIYPTDFPEVDAFRSLESSLRITTCLSSMELQTLNLGCDQAIATSLANGMQQNSSIQSLTLSAWGSTTMELFLQALSVRLEDYPLRSLEISRRTFQWPSTRQQCSSSGIKNISQLTISSWQGVMPEILALDSNLTYLQLTKNNLASHDIDQWLRHLAVSCPNLTTLDVRDNNIESLQFKGYHTSPSRLTSLREFYLDGNPLWEKTSKKDMRSLTDGLFCLLNTNPRLTSFFHPEQNTVSSRTKQQARQQLKHIKLIKTICSLAQGSSDYATQLPVGAWPLLLEHANCLLKGSAEHQAGAIYPFLLNASAVLGNQRTTLSSYRAPALKKKRNRTPWWSLQNVFRFQNTNNMS